MSARRTVSELLEEARERIVRLVPVEAFSAAAAGALIVDIRSDRARERDGIVPGSLHIPRTVLEWRTDPDSPWRNAEVTGLDQQLILLCEHGYSSSLAASTLVDLGFEHAGEVIGGFEGWAAAGLPVSRLAVKPADDALPGLGPRD